MSRIRRLRHSTRSSLSRTRCSGASRSLASRADMQAMWRGWSSAALALVVAVLLPLATFLVAAWLLGWQLQSVQTGSMSPTYPVGSLLVVGQIDAGAVQPGMAITFEDPSNPGRVVTHRVERIAPGDALAFITHGDANATPDALPVPARLVRRRVLWSV